MRIINENYIGNKCVSILVDINGIKRFFVPLKSAKWIKTGKISVRCSACNYLPAENDYNYCPNCGAKMGD